MRYLQRISPTLPVGLAVGLLVFASGLMAAGSFTFNSETKQPDVSAEAKDTAPKYNPTSHVRVTTKEEAGNFRQRDILGQKIFRSSDPRSTGGDGSVPTFPGGG